MEQVEKYQSQPCLSVDRILRTMQVTLEPRRTQIDTRLIKLGTNTGIERSKQHLQTEKDAMPSADGSDRFGGNPLLRSYDAIQVQAAKVHLHT
jgi:hypothetical protein